jgi:hypothetical protein
MFPADTKKIALSNSRLQRIVKDQAKMAAINTPVTSRVCCAIALPPKCTIKKFR